MTLPTHAAEEASPGKARRQEDPNLSVFSATDVAAHYASLDYLSPCEKMLFEEFLKPGDAILDLGVGGGRTTPHLSRLASRCVGVDYAPAMVAACRQKFPNLEFRRADASNLHLFDDAMFDCVVSAFNGMDYFLTNELRQQCIAEIHRVLKKNGVAIISRHNPRAILARPSWGRNRVEEMARRLAGASESLFFPLKSSLMFLRVAAAMAQSAAESLVRTARTIPHRIFWSGHGYMVDPADGGLLAHYAVPERVISEMNRQGFQLLRFAGSDYPQRSGIYVTDWYYYVFQKTAESAGSTCA